MYDFLALAVHLSLAIIVSTRVAKQKTVRRIKMSLDISSLTSMSMVPLMTVTRPPMERNMAQKKPRMMGKSPRLGDRLGWLSMLPT